MAVVQHRKSGRKFYGSAAAINFGERILLATARHNLNAIYDPGQLEILLPVPSPQVVVSAFGQSNEAPTTDYPDVAWIEVHADAFAVPGFTPLPLDDLLATTPQHYGGRGIWCQGFPESQIVRFDDGGESLTSTTIQVESLPHVAEGTEGGPADTFFIEYPPHDYPFDDELPELRGISGGGVWQLPGRQGRSLRMRPRMVAIVRSESEERKNCLRCTPVRRWLELLYEDDDLLELRPMLEPQLWRT